MNFIPNNSIGSSGFEEIYTARTAETPQTMDGYTPTDLSIKCLKSEPVRIAIKEPASPIGFDDSKGQRNRNSKTGNKKSFVWKYFAHPKTNDGIEDRSRTECIECKSQLAFNASGTTTTMLNHLKSRHPKIAECEEWRRMKLNSSNTVKNELLNNTESPTETLSPSASFDFQKAVNSSPEYKNSEQNTHSLFQNDKHFHNGFSDQGQLMSLAKQLMVTSTIPTMTIDHINTMTTTQGHSLSQVCTETKANSTHNTTGRCADTNNNYSDNNRSVMKRKRKRPICKQNGFNDRNNELYEMSANKYERNAGCESPDLAPFQSMTAMINSSANIKSMLGHNILYHHESTNQANHDHINPNRSPFQIGKPLSSLPFGSSPRSPLATKMGITESDRIIVYWLIKDLRPSSVLEESGMKTLFSSLMPSVTIPSVSSLKNQILPSIYWSLKTEIYNDFSSQSGSAFSIELWDNPSNNCMYASVKLNFYSKTTTQLRSKMIATKEINEKFMCSDLLINCCNELGIDFASLQFLPVVMNNPDSMADELANVGEIEQNKKITIIPCLISTLQEVVRVGFQQQDIIDLLEKCRVLKELVGAYNLELDNCAFGNNAFLSSKYSTEKFDLIFWVYLNLDQIVDMLDCFNRERFNEDDELFLKQLTPLLEHIYQTLNVIEQNKLSFSASMIKSIILTMNKSPFQPRDEDHLGVKQFKVAVKNRLSKIYPESGPLHDLLSVATVLDPRFKRCQESDEILMLQELRKKISSVNDTSSTSVFLQETSNTIKREDLSSIFGDDCLSQEPKSELDQYLNEHKIDIEKNPIKWWHDNARRFPTLSTLALKYMCIPLANQYGPGLSESTSAVYHRRKDIDPDEIDQYLFLNHNWK